MTMAILSGMKGWPLVECELEHMRWRAFQSENVPSWVEDGVKWKVAFATLTKETGVQVKSETKHRFVNLNMTAPPTDWSVEFILLTSGWKLKCFHHSQIAVGPLFPMVGIVRRQNQKSKRKKKSLWMNKSTAWTLICSRNDLLKQFSYGAI